MNFNLKDMEVGNMGGLGALVSSSLPLLAMVTDTVTQDGNDFTIELKFSKIYELIGSLTDLSKLPAVVTDLLPKEMTVKAVLHTDGNVLTGVDVIDSVMTTKDGAGDGTFNMTSRFNLFGAPAESLDVISMVSDELKAVEARKILNIDTHGDILFEAAVPADPEVEGSTDTVKTTRTISWKLVSNFDLFKAMETNFILEDAIFNDNFLHFQLKLDGEPVLDLAFSPATLNTHDMILGVGAQTLVNTLFPGFVLMPAEKPEDQDVTLEMFISGYFGPNVFLPINTKALGYMISGVGGKVEEPLPAQNYYNPAKYEIVGAEAKAAEEGAGIDFGAILSKIGNFVSIANGELEIKVADLLKELKLDATISDLVGKLTGNGETARFTNTVFNFAKAETETYDVKADLKKGKYNPDTDSYAEREITNVITGTGLAIDLEWETDQGFLKVYNMDYNEEKMISYDKSKRTTLKELNGFVGNPDYKVRFSGHDLAGTELNFTSGMMVAAPILGYVGLDPTKIGVQQTIEVVTGIPDTSSIFTILSMLLKQLGVQVEGFDLSAIDNLLNSLKLGRFEADIILSEAEYEVGLYEKSTGKELGADGALDMTTPRSTNKYNLKAKVTYLANEAYPEELVEEATLNGGNYDSDWLWDPNYYKPLYLKGLVFPLPQILIGNTAYFGAQGDATVTVVYKGAELEKVYRFAKAKETTYTLDANKNYFRLGSGVKYQVFEQYFTLHSVYAEEGGDKTYDYRLSRPGWETLEFVNSEELTGISADDVKSLAFSDLGNTVFTFKKTGVAKFNVRFNGVLMTTVEIPVLPNGGNAAVSDASFSMPAGAETSEFTGNLAFEVLDNATVLEAYRRVHLNATVQDDNGKTIAGTSVTVNGGEDNAFVVNASGAQSVNFKITGIPAGMYRIKIVFEVKFADAAHALLKTGAIPMYYQFKAGSAFESFDYGSAIPANSVTFTEFGQPNVWKLAFENGKYVLKRANSEEALELNVGVYDANGALIEGGVDADGKVSAYGTLKIKITFGGKDYEVTRGFIEPEPPAV